MPTKIIITGCSGFLGHHLIGKGLEMGWQVIGIDKRPIPPGHLLPSQFIQTDVFDLEAEDLRDVQYVVHLAFAVNIPNSVRHPERTTYQNIDMTIHLLEVCKEAGIKKFLFPSTASLYSKNPTPWTEDMPPLPVEPYSWQKLSCEYACKLYSQFFPTIIFRLFQVFGEFQRKDSALYAFQQAKKDGKLVNITRNMFQSTFETCQRDFIYAGDIAEAMITALESEDVKSGEIFNIASGKVHTMEEIAKAIKAKINWIPMRDYEVVRHEGNIDKIKALGWKPTTDILQWLETIPTKY